MKSRLPAAAAVLACVIMTAAGCSAQPEPQPTPLFSSEDEAFAAAEATYRAYVDALNQVDLSDPETFEEVYMWTTGDFNADERKTLSEWHAEGWVVNGETRIVRLDHLTSTADFDEVNLGSCVDVSSVVLQDASGESQVDPARPAVQSTHVTTVLADGSPTGYRIAEIVGFELTPPCMP